MVRGAAEAELGELEHDAAGLSPVAAQGRREAGRGGSGRVRRR